MLKKDMMKSAFTKAKPAIKTAIGNTRTAIKNLPNKVSTGPTVTTLPFKPAMGRTVKPAGKRLTKPRIPK